MKRAVHLTQSEVQDLYDAAKCLDAYWRRYAEGPDSPALAGTFYEPEIEAWRKMRRVLDAHRPSENPTLSQSLATAELIVRNHMSGIQLARKPRLGRWLKELVFGTGIGIFLLAVVLFFTTGGF